MEKASPERTIRICQTRNAFENQFLNQGKNENRTISATLSLGWQLLGLLPKEELDRVSPEILEKYYPKNA